MAVKITFEDNSDKVISQLNLNVPRALNAMGTKAVNLILWQMQQGFGKPIRQTGDLQRDVNYEVHAESNTVDVGNSLHYAPYVHDGTRKMAARPYIRNALTGDNHQKQLQKVAEAYLKEGFDG